MGELSDEQRQAYDRLAATVDHVARSALVDGRRLPDDEVIGDFIVVAQVMSAELLDSRVSRYVVIQSGGSLPAHAAAGLHHVGVVIANSGWDQDG